HYTQRARIAQSSALPPVADKSASPLRDVSQGKACLIVSSFEAELDMVNIAKTSTLPHESTSRVTSLTADEAQELEISMLKAKVKLLKDREGGAEKGSNETEEMINVLTSMDASIVLSSGVAEVPTGSGSIPTVGPLAAGVPTAGPIFATATVVTPYTRRKGKEKIIESETPKKKKIQEQMDIQMARQLEEEIEREAQRMNGQIARDAEIARIHAEEELQMMINKLDRSNEIVAKYLQEYEQIPKDLSIGERIDLISDLVKYQENYAQVLKYQTLQRKPRSKKQKKDYYMAVIKGHTGWKIKDFKGMSFEKIEAKFNTVWKQIEDFIPMGSKEEAERLKRKGLRLEQESEKKLKTSEEVPEEVKSSEEVPEEKVKEMMLLVPIEEHLDREDLNKLWELVKVTPSIRPADSDKEMELWVELKRLYEPDDEDQLRTHTQNIMHAPVEWKLYDSCGVHHVTFNDKEIFMLVEKDYPLRKGLAIVMISYKLQVENYSQMASDLILKICKIANRPRQEDD
nr:hypothetical protein [Tanacetum cinerariifolium]